MIRRKFEAAVKDRVRQVLVVGLWLFAATITALQGQEDGGEALSVSAVHRDDHIQVRIKNQKAEPIVLLLWPVGKNQYGIKFRLGVDEKTAVFPTKETLASQDAIWPRIQCRYVVLDGAKGIEPHREFAFEIPLEAKSTYPDMRLTGILSFAPLASFAQATSLLDLQEIMRKRQSEFSIAVERKSESADQR